MEPLYRLTVVPTAPCETVVAAPFCHVIPGEIVELAKCQGVVWAGSWWCIHEYAPGLRMPSWPCDFLYDLSK
jgi:hypothetical protein